MRLSRLGGAILGVFFGEMILSVSHNGDAPLFWIVVIGVIGAAVGWKLAR